MIENENEFDFRPKLMLRIDNKDDDDVNWQHQWPDLNNNTAGIYRNTQTADVFPYWMIVVVVVDAAAGCQFSFFILQMLIGFPPLFPDNLSY